MRVAISQSPLVSSAMLVAFAAAVAVACSSEDSSDGGGSSTTFWPAAYSTPVALPVTTYHAADTATAACMTCHGDTNALTTTKLVYGGIIYNADGTRAAGAQVGVFDGAYSSFVHTASNGMYWAVGSTSSVNWAAADIRVRSANGELVKVAADARSGDCDSCHTATQYTIYAP